MSSKSRKGTKSRKITRRVINAHAEVSIQQNSAHALISSSQGNYRRTGPYGYFKLGALLESLRRPMSYKLALHVHAAFTEQVLPI